MKGEFHLKPLKGKNDQQVTELVDEIMKVLTSLTRDDLEKLSDEVDEILGLMGHLAAIIDGEVTRQKKDYVKKAIRTLLDQGFSFETIEIDDMFFKIDKNKKIRFIESPENLDNGDIPF